MKTPALTVLGGGPAGLAIGYYAAAAGVSCAILEAGPRSGGNCTTFVHGDFRFDSGAHRFHDQDAEITRDVRSLLGEELRPVEVPSYIYTEGRLVDFPLSPLNLWARLGTLELAKAGFDVLASRAFARGPLRNLQDQAVATYGRRVATRFLLNYSEKLWGLPCEWLSPDTAGKRLKGLDLRTFLAELFGGRATRDRHLDGRFWYPRLGYGCIADALAAACGDGALRCNARVTRIVHDGARILAVVVGAGEPVDVNDVVSTLPLDLFVRALDPAPPRGILDLAEGLRHRHVVLAVFFLDRPSVNDAGTVYFPSRDFPFTRVYEPRNRSDAMSPPGKTSLVVEIPCDGGDAAWAMDDDGVLALVRGPLEAIGWLRPGDVAGTTVRRLANAYPVLEVGYEARVASLGDWLARFTNLRFSGRNGRFQYSWLHEMLRFGKDIVAESVAKGRDEEG